MWQIKTFYNPHDMTVNSWLRDNAGQIEVKQIVRESNELIILYTTN